MTANENATAGNLLFSFGVITDTHIRAPHGDLSSPYPVNELANDRAFDAARLLADQQAAFYIHLGDMVHPLPGMPAYDNACEAALQLFKPLLPNLYFVPGNHDVGDKPMQGLPAASISPFAIEAYQKHFGSDYFHFKHNDCLMIVFNSSLINCENDRARSQQAWMDSLCRNNSGDRIFLFLHYPPFIHSSTEAEHYDNIAEPGRSWLLSLLEEYEIEMTLSGHVHHHFYNRVGKCKCYTMPPTSFTRQDFAEMFKVGPAAEFGRDDKAKYSVAVVNVYEEGHKIKYIPTHQAKKQGLSEEVQADRARLEIKRLTVPLRHAWYESIDLPYNGPMEEFSRKRARNDYLFLRLRQMSISDVRIPIDDIIDPVGRRRVADYVADGYRFHVFCPWHQLANKLPAAQVGIALISSLECVFSGPIDEMDEALLPMVDVPVIAGYALTGTHLSATDKPFAHSVSSGFSWDDAEPLMAKISEWNFKLHGVIVQIPWEQDALAILNEMQQLFASLPMKGIACIRLARSNPAESNFDDDAIRSRIKSVVRCAETLPDVELQLDTVMDVDRGYSPRHGLMDRLTNLRVGGLALCKS